MNPIRISKTRYMQGLQCPKALWLDVHRRDLILPVDPRLQAVFDQGHLIGELARQRHPGGRLVSEDHLQTAKAVSATQDAVAAGAKILFEAAAVHTNAMARADILKRVAGGAWDILEVKSSTQVKEEFLDDLALQRWVFEGAGFKIRKTILLLVDTSYVRRGPIDVTKLFIELDCTDELAERLSDVGERLGEFTRLLREADPPVKEIARHCESPHACKFVNHCWQAVPDYSIYDLTGVRWPKLEELRHAGYLETTDIPDSFALTDAQWHQVQADKSGKMTVDSEALRTFFGGLTYPLYFLDFESVNPALPPYDGLSPFQMLPVQASIHIQGKAGATPSHLEFLGDGKIDPRPSLVKFLRDGLGARGSVICYSSFEKTRLGELAEQYAPDRKALLSMADRIVDLAEPFRRRSVVHPAFKGSYSIKAVLPALVPGLSYESLAIGDGGSASQAYLRLMGGVSRDEETEIRRSLLEYCGQDTLGMVELLSVLHKMAA